MGSEIIDFLNQTKTFLQNVVPTAATIGILIAVLLHFFAHEKSRDFRNYLIGAIIVLFVAKDFFIPFVLKLTQGM